MLNVFLNNITCKSKHMTFKKILRMLSIIILSELLKPTDFFKHVFNIFMTKYGGRLKNLKHMVSLLYYLDTLQGNYTNMNLVLHCREKKKNEHLELVCLRSVEIISER